jgi:hypothetical protein
MGKARHARPRGTALPPPGLPDAAVRPRHTAGVLGACRNHALFCVALLVAAGVRFVVVLGYPPALWFSDSLPYVQAVEPLSPSPVRPAGYSFFLAMLASFHSIWVVTVAQAGMGLTTATAVYVVLRRYKLSGAAATLAAAPVLFSAYEIQLEHFVLSDTLFGLLVTLAVVIMLWRPVPPILVCAFTGLILAWAILDREQGILLPVVFCLYLCALLARQVRIRAILVRVVVMCVAVVVPVLGYARWFEQSHDSFALTSSTGVFLYSRVSTFASCSVIKPPADERWLCISKSPGERPDPNFYAWAAKSPINLRPPGGWAFDSRANSLATNFAIRAIKAQPISYLAAVWLSTTENFELQSKGNAAWLSERRYRFPATTPPPLRALARANRELPDYASGYKYNDHRDPSTRLVQPFARWIGVYQRFVILPGLVLALIALTGLIGVGTAWRRFGGPALLPWLTGAVLILTPAATTDYGARYLIASIPAFCIAAGVGAKQIGEETTDVASRASASAEA